MAGAFAFRQIYNILNEVYAASNSATPQEIGGKVYMYLKEFSDAIERRVNQFGLTDLDRAPNSLKEEFRRKSIMHINGIYASSSSLDDLNENEKSFFRQLIIIHDMMNGILSGKISYEVKIGDSSVESSHPSQTPDAPS